MTITALNNPTNIQLTAINCRDCGAKLADTNGKTLIGPSFDLGKPSWLLCKCGAKRFWGPARCDKIEESERKEV